MVRIDLPYFWALTAVTFFRKWVKNSTPVWFTSEQTQGIIPVYAITGCSQLARGLFVFYILCVLHRSLNIQNTSCVICTHSEPQEL